MELSPPIFEEWLTLRRVDENEYASVWPTESNGLFAQDTGGYGGMTVAFAVKAAFATVSKERRLYSCMGHFLGVAIAGQPLAATINRVRDSRVFTTRRVEVFQSLQGKRKPVMTVQLDFQIPEPATVLK